MAPAASANVTFAPERSAWRPTTASIARNAAASDGVARPIERAWQTIHRASPSLGAHKRSNASACVPEQIPTMAPPGIPATVTAGLSGPSTPRIAGANAATTLSRLAASERCSSEPRRCRNRATPPDRSTGKLSPTSEMESCSMSQNPRGSAPSSSSPNPPLVTASRRGSFWEMAPSPAPLKARVATRDAACPDGSSLPDHTFFPASAARVLPRPGPSLNNGLF